MTSSRDERIIEEASSRTTVLVLRVIEQQLRDFAAAVSPSVSAEVALLAMADDLRDSIPSIEPSSPAFPKFNGAQDAKMVADGQRYSPDADWGNRGVGHRSHRDRGSSSLAQEPQKAAALPTPQERSTGPVQ